MSLAALTQRMIFADRAFGVADSNLRLAALLLAARQIEAIDGYVSTATDYLEAVAELDPARGLECPS